MDHGRFYMHSKDCVGGAIKILQRYFYILVSCLSKQSKQNNQLKKKIPLYTI